MFGRFEGHSLLVSATERTEFKPLEYTAEPNVGFHTFFTWEEQQDKIVQVWHVNYDEPIEIDAEPTDYESALNRLGVET